jgi:hypothetical protein
MFFPCTESSFFKQVTGENDWKLPALLMDEMKKLLCLLGCNQVIPTIRQFAKTLHVILAHNILSL